MKQLICMGLYDMRGNVCEWCKDWYSDNYYSRNPSSNHKEPVMGTSRVYRGGCWMFDGSSECRSSRCFHNGLSYSMSRLSFRLAL